MNIFSLRLGIGRLLAPQYQPAALYTLLRVFTYHCKVQQPHHAGSLNGETVRVFLTELLSRTAQNAELVHAVFERVEAEQRVILRIGQRDACKFCHAAAVMFHGGENFRIGHIVHE